MKQERQAEALVLPSERREKKCERGAFIPYEYANKCRLNIIWGFKLKTLKDFFYVFKYHLI